MTLAHTDFDSSFRLSQIPWQTLNLDPGHETKSLPDHRLLLTWLNLNSDPATYQALILLVISGTHTIVTSGPGVRIDGFLQHAWAHFSFPITAASSGPPPHVPRMARPLKGWFYSWAQTLPVNFHPGHILLLWNLMPRTSAIICSSTWKYLAWAGPALTLNLTAWKSKQTPLFGIS